MALEEGTPERLDGIATGLIIEPERDITIRSARLTVDDRPETVATLNLERRVEALNVSVLDVLRECDEARPRIGRSIFEFGVADLEHKALGIAIGSGASQWTCATEPGSITGICRKVKGCTR